MSLSDIEIPNTLGLEEYNPHMGQYMPKDHLSIEDFLGNDGNSLEPSVEGFREVFGQTLEMDGESYTIGELIEELERGARYSNEIHKPGLEALAFVVDCVSFGIKPLFDCACGYDIITGEELSGGERAWRGVDAALSVLDVFGVTKLAGMGLKALGKEVLEEIGEHAGKKVIEETGERLAKELAEEAGERIVREVAEEAGERISREALEETGERLGREVAEETGEKISREVGAEAREKIAKEAIEEGREKAEKEIAQEVEAEVKEEVGEAVSERAKKTIADIDGETSTSTHGYSIFADGMSPEDAARYIANNEKAFFNEFSERARAVGLNDTQIAEAFEAMRSGDYAKMATYFDTSSPVDGAVFWSGNKEGAAAYANSIGGTIMEQTPGGRVFDNWRGLQGMYPNWDTGVTPQKPIWTALSSQYAERAAGDVTYVHTMRDGKPYYGAVWNDIEKKILLQNMLDGKVTNISEVIIDAK